MVPGRILIGCSLIFIAVKVLDRLGFADAHIAICGLTAIGYGFTLLIPSSKWAPILSSFIFSWVLFYTIYAGTTILLFEVLVKVFIDDNAFRVIPAWRYHTLVNIALIFLFWAGMDRIKWILVGLWSAMMAAPLMLLYLHFKDGAKIYEGNFFVWIYFFLGMALLIVDKFFLKEEHLTKIRKAILISLWVYLVVMLVPNVTQFL